MRRALKALAALGAIAGCTQIPRSDSAYATQLPPEVRASYDVFAYRCSKCHSLSRPLDSGIDDDASWARYVDRMRRQPSSGISIADRAPILAFLHHYSVEERKRKALSAPDADAGSAPDGGAK